MIPTHEPLPPERSGITHKATIGGVHVYIRTGEYADGRLGELFVTVDKHGAEMRLIDGVAICMSVALQHGTPLHALTRKLKGQRMGTGGMTDDPGIRMVSSILDYMARWLEAKYTTPQERAQW